MIFAGCDPGISGGFAALSSDGKPLAAFPMPLSPAKKIDPSLVFKALIEVERLATDMLETVFFGIEKVFTMPQDVDNISARIDDIDAAIAAGCDTTPAISLAREACAKRDGRVGVLKIGINYGLVVGVMASFGWRYAVIPPRTWQAEFWVGADTGLESKKKTYQVCSRLWPDFDFTAGGRRRGFHDGICDAFGIASYCRTRYGSLNQKPTEDL